MVFENEQEGKLIAEVSAMDPDSGVNHGGPFVFSLPNQDRNPTFDHFRLVHKPSGGANGNGSALIYSKQKFDREDRKYYYVPIIIEDVGGLAGKHYLSEASDFSMDHRVFN